MNIFSFKNIGDERLQSLQYRAGSRAFMITLVLGWLGILGAFLFTDAGRTPVIFAFAAPLFIGLVIYENSNKEYEEFLKEQLGKSPEIKRYFLLKAARGTIAIATGAAITNFFTSWHYNMGKSWLFGIVFGIIMGSGIYYRLVTKDDW